jgi:hypothetical protein
VQVVDVRTPWLGVFQIWSPPSRRILLRAFSQTYRDSQPVKRIFAL